MASKAKWTFDANIQRASYFLDVHEATQSGAGAPKTPRRELPRGAIVFAVGAIDAYLCEVSAEILIDQVQKTSASPQLRGILARVQKDVPALPLEVALLDTQAERMARIRDSIVEYFENQTSQLGVKGVSSTIARLGGNPADLWSALIQRGYPEPQGILHRWTDVRHQIVHQGKKPSVRRPDARKFIEFAQALVQQVDSVVSSLVPKQGNA